MPPKRKAVVKNSGAVTKKRNASSGGDVPDRRKKTGTRAKTATAKSSAIRTRKQPGRRCKTVRPATPPEVNDNESDTDESLPADQVEVWSPVEGRDPQEPVDGEPVDGGIVEEEEDAENVPHDDPPTTDAGLDDGSTEGIERAHEDDMTAVPESQHGATGDPRRRSIPPPSYSPLSSPSSGDENTFPEDDAEEILGEAIERLWVRLDGEEVNLIVKVQVGRDAYGLQSRLVYRALLFLAVKGRREQVQVGYIETCRVSKPSHLHRAPNFTVANTDPWLDELLTININAAPPSVSTTAKAMQALFDERGHHRAGLGHLRKELRDNSLMVIQTVYIFEEYQRQGFMRSSLTSFYSLLLELPEWLGFRGTMVLVPARPADVSGDCWGRRTHRQVENQIRNVFRRLGYTDYVRDVMINGSRTTVMDRTINEEDDSESEDEPGDDGKSNTDNGPQEEHTEAHSIAFVPLIIEE